MESDHNVNSSCLSACDSQGLEYFSILKKSNKSRLGKLITKHGTINTPTFMPVGTQGIVKSLVKEQLEETGAEIMLSNTYHLLLRPGLEIIKNAGGLHKFMNWTHPILTDSGGFQVMSLNKLRKITEEGVLFKSHINGSKIFLTPENVTEAQNIFGVDITMIFDECTESGASHEKAEKSMNLSLRWAKRSRSSFLKRQGHLQFGITQGSIYKDLRKISAEELIKLDFEGYAIGGLAIGEPQDTMFDIIDFSTDILPANKPRYLMGVGKPLDIIGAVLRGVDMFDCVMPTRCARNGRAFTSKGKLNIRNKEYAHDLRALDTECLCYTCSSYTRSYIHHLDKAGEMSFSTLMTIHNLTFYQNLMKEIRKSIEQDKLEDLYVKYSQLSF